jgi:HPt (histidine-containing phosphotransfer) domain-containing protein
VKNAPIDLVHLSRQTAGDRDLERELLALFADQCVRQLQTILDAASIDLRRDAAHTLKGAARAVGAWDVATAAEVIENHADAPSADELAALRQRSDCARHAIAGWLSAA